MIRQEQLIEIGTIQKVHGLKGEMNVSVVNDVFDAVRKCPYLVCEMDGIFVPFFIESYRWKGNASMLLKLEDVDTIEKAGEFCGQKLFFDRRCFTKKEAEEYESAEEEEAGLIGYVVEDVTLGTLGPITDIDDQTANVLFCIDYKGRELLVPAADELIESIDDEQKIIRMNLPAGLVNPDEAESEDDPFLKI
ncbi:MAG: 16S rRNA processing protein RimM [Bacteroidales bacterium]|nr:16S rRNA processing protein RimM [Bacteroidales bacterium]